MAGDQHSTTVEPRRQVALRKTLPGFGERRSLGRTGLSVSPFCVGMVGSADRVPEAYAAGMNFFFVTADMHWPLYEPLRAGLRRLLQSSPEVRQKIVVAAVSYVAQREFSHAPFEEVLEAIPELGHLDLAVIGGSYASDFSVRHLEYQKHLPAGAAALGATFHERAAAVTAANSELLEIAFIRYNSAHAGAETDVFPLLRADSKTAFFTFKSTSGYVDPEQLSALHLPPGKWRPDITDHYRFALTQSAVDGVLWSPVAQHHIQALDQALSRGPLSEAQLLYMKRLSALAAGTIELVDESVEAR